MLLICDCGSTKAEWVLLDGEDMVARFVTDGFNPNFCNTDTITGIVNQSVRHVSDYQDVSNVFFYGSGCGSDSNRLRVMLIISKIYKNAKIEVYPDTLGACHALFGSNPGIACILGTGSNACLYDGKDITQSVVSLGFIIGDEGSGCHIGKHIVHDYFYKIMPEDLSVKFDEKYGLDRDTFLKRVYQGESPSKYLAEFARFAAENIDNQYIKDVVNGCFEEFLSSFRPTTPSGFGRNDMGFVGSVAFAFREILLQVLANHNLRCEKILKNPMDGLVEYYKSFTV